ncbi:MAG: glycosyltransferase family 4 protein [Chloroflexi bacterium]|nr:glycosyltransferase family 4 protein [Chloroflexota bacterium]
MTTNPSSRPPRPVAIVTPLYDPAVGGVERYVGHLARGLLARGIPVEIVTTDPGADQPRAEIRDGVPVRRFPTVLGDRLVYPAPRLARWLSRHASAYRLIHGHNLHTLLPAMGALAARRADVPFVLTGHWHGGGHTPARQLLHVPYRPVAAWVARQAAAIVANSPSEAAQLTADFGTLPVTVITEGVEPPITRTDPQDGVPLPTADGPTILSVGRLEHYKGAQRLPGALAHLPGHRLVIVGDGPDREAILGAADRHGVADRVLLRGRVSDEELGAWYRSADALVTLSRHESFGLTVLEAAAAGLPVAASDIGAHRDSADLLPVGRVTLVPPDGDAAVIAQGITTAIAEGRRDGKAAPVVPTWDQLVTQTVALYERVAQ